VEQVLGALQKKGVITPVRLPRGHSRGLWRITPDSMNEIALPDFAQDFSNQEKLMLQFLLFEFQGIVNYDEVAITIDIDTPGIFVFLEGIHNNTDVQKIFESWNLKIQTDTKSRRQSFYFSPWKVWFSYYKKILLGQKILLNEHFANDLKMSVEGVQASLRDNGFIEVEGEPGYWIYTKASEDVKPSSTPLAASSTLDKANVASSRIGEEAQVVSSVAFTSTAEGDFTKGGIDFDPTNMNLQIKRDGKGVPLPLPQQNLEQINIQGLFPVIINITPINAETLPIFLGQAPKEPAREPELTASFAG
jgi:hypothetical protein